MAQPKATITCDVEASGYIGCARPDPDQQKSDLAVTPIDEKEDVCDAYYDHVIKIVVKGNLKHRIEKLGRISADSSDESISDTDETHRTNKQTKSKQIFTSTN